VGSSAEGIIIPGATKERLRIVRDNALGERGFLLGLRSTPVATEFALPPSDGSRAEIEQASQLLRQSARRADIGTARLPLR